MAFSGQVHHQIWIGLAHRSRRVYASAEPADAEAIFLDCMTHAVQPVEQSDAAVAAARVAGAEAAAAAIAAHVGKRPAEPKQTPVPGSPSLSKKQRKDAATAARAVATAGSSAATGIQLAGAPAAPPSAAAAAASAAAAATAGAGGAPLVGPGAIVPAKPKVVKIEPFQAGEPAAGLVTTKIDKAGGGLIEVIDRLHFNHHGGKVGMSQMPCPWVCATKTCPNLVKATGCNKCTNKAQPVASVMSVAKAACTPAFLASLPADSAVATAA